MSERGHSVGGTERSVVSSELVQTVGDGSEKIDSSEGRSYPEPRPHSPRVVRLFYGEKEPQSRTETDKQHHHQSVISGRVGGHVSDLDQTTDCSSDIRFWELDSNQFPQSGTDRDGGADHA